MANPWILGLVLIGVVCTMTSYTLKNTHKLLSNILLTVVFFIFVGIVIYNVVIRPTPIVWGSGPGRTQ